MDGTAAISGNLEALKRILAGLVAMAGLGTRQSPDRLSPNAGCRIILPRHLRLAILRLLRPAESAARRLIIAAARGLVAPVPPPRKPRPKPATMEPQLRRFGIAVVVSPDDPASVARILPHLRGRGTVGDGGGGGRPRTLTLALFDPPRRVRANGYRLGVPAHASPRILFPGAIKPFSLPSPPSPDDPVDATRLTLRLAALAAALDDLPGQAKRFARWKARRADATGAHKENRDIRKGSAPRRIMRISPLRSGRPPGGRLARFDPSTIRRRNIREVDEILAHVHALALYALESPDTS